MSTGAIGDPGLFPVIAAVLAVAFLLTLFILPDYICWRRRLRQLPTVTAHQIQFIDEDMCEEALKTITSVKESEQFDKFCEISRAMTKTKENRAGSDGLLFDGKFSVGEMPEEYGALERQLFDFKTPVDQVIGPIQTHVDAYHLAYVTNRWDPLMEKRKEEQQKKRAELEEPNQNQKKKKNWCCKKSYKCHKNNKKSGCIVEDWIIYLFIFYF